MDVGHVGPSGPGRNQGRPEKVDPQEAPGATPRPVDEASISTNARDHLAWVEALTRELERQEAGREERVREVGEKLRNGELDDPEVYRAAAEAMLGW